MLINNTMQLLSVSTVHSTPSEKQFLHSCDYSVNICASSPVTFVSCSRQVPWLPSRVQARHYFVIRIMMCQHKNAIRQCQNHVPSLLPLNVWCEIIRRISRSRKEKMCTARLWWTSDVNTADCCVAIQEKNLCCYDGLLFVIISVLVLDGVTVELQWQGHFYGLA